jgi:serine/threonine-protein kinase
MKPGTIVAYRYRVKRLLRQSTIGEVLLAEHLGTGAEVEIKLVRGAGAGRSTLDRSTLCTRLRREACALATIGSERVQRVIGVDEDAERGPLLVYERLEDESLLDLFERRGPMPLAELHPLIIETWLGLVDMHDHRVIHRDLKPSNIVVARRGDGRPRVKLRGLDVCKLAGSEDLTEMGMSLGTFSFMATDLIGKAKTADHRADIYACATLVYQALSGQLPYTAVMVEMKATTDARTLAEAIPGPVDPRLEAFIARGLARNPRHRFHSAREALADWRELCPPELLD